MWFSIFMCSSSPQNLQILHRRSKTWMSGETDTILPNLPLCVNRASGRIPEKPCRFAKTAYERNLPDRKPPISSLPDLPR
jgi:hypothetical protein